MQRRNITCLFITLEMLSSYSIFVLTLSDLFGQRQCLFSSLNMLLSVAKLAENTEVDQKVVAVILNQGSSGIDVFLEYLDAANDQDKIRHLSAALLCPQVLKNLIIPLFLQDMKSKNISNARRNQAAAALSRMGLLLED